MIPVHQLCLLTPDRVTYTKHMSLRVCTVSVSTIIHRCPACAGLRYSVIYVRKLTSGVKYEKKSMGVGLYSGALPWQP